MSKNKFNWVIVIALIAVLTVPIATAQVLGGITGRLAGVNWYYLLVNAAVIFFVLFLLQAVLVPNKEGKEKTSMWIIMLAAALFVSHLYGQSGYIWQVGPLSSIFDIHVLVNTFVISVVLYFVVAFVPKLDLKSPEGQTGKIILIILIAATIAYNLPHDKFLWNNDNVKMAIGYLFSGEMLTRPDGSQVARGMVHYNGGLFVLVSSFVIISFFLNSYLMKTGSKAVNYMLAGLFAFVMASPPSSPLGQVVMLGEFFFIFIFWEALKTTIGASGKERWFALALAILVVSLTSAAVTMNSPEYRGMLGTVGCHLPVIGINCTTSTGATVSGTPPTASGGWGNFVVLILELIFMAATGFGLWKAYTKFAGGAVGGAAPVGAPAPAPVAPAGPAAPAAPAQPVAGRPWWRFWGP